MTGRHGRGSTPVPEPVQTRAQPESGSTTPTVGRQFAWVALGRVGAAAAQAALMVLLIRSTAPEQFAVVGTTYGALIFAQATASLGLPNLVVRERSHGADQPIVATALWLADRVAVGTAIVLGLTCAVLGLLVDPTFLPLIPLAVWAAAELNADTWIGVALADGRGHVVTANLLGRRLLNFGLFLGLHLVSTPVLVSYAISSAVSAMVSVLVAHRIVAGQVQAAPTVPLRTVLRGSRSYWVNSMASLARNIDAALVHAVTTAVQASFYAAAARLSGPMRLLPQSLATVLLPLAARSKGGLGSIMKTVGAALGLMALIYGAAVALLPWLVVTLLGASYQGAVRALQVTAVGLIFAAAASMLTAVLQGVGDTTYVARVALATTAVFLVAVLVGAQVGDAVGAASGAGLAYLLQSVLLYVRIRRHGR